MDSNSAAFALPVATPSVTQEVHLSQKQPTLREYADGLRHVAADVENQTQAYSKLKTLLAAIEDAPQTLPTVAVSLIEAEDVSQEMFIKLSRMSPDRLATFKPMFESLLAEAGDKLLTAWEQFNKLSDATAPIVAASRKAMGGQ